MKTSLVFSILLFFSLFSLTTAGAQSRYLEDGIGGTSLQIKGFGTTEGFDSLGLAASYSIGGIMDFGTSIDIKKGTLDNHESYDFGFSLLYNMILIKQSDIMPLNVQLECSYGYINTKAEYLDHYNRRRTAQGFSLGALIYHELFRQSFIRVTLGGKADYRNFITTTTDFSNPLIPEIISVPRTEDLRAGGFAAVSLQLDLWPVITLEFQALYNTSTSMIEMIPSVVLTNPSY